LLLQARLLYQTPRKGQRQSLQCRENHRGTRGDALGAACWPFLSTGIALRRENDARTKALVAPAAESAPPARNWRRRAGSRRD
jgi:hypothetical protein